MGDLSRHDWLALQFFQPGGNPLVLMANALEMKGEDVLGVGHRDASAGSALSLSGHLLQALEIIQAPLEVGQALAENLLPLLGVEKLEERDARKKLGLIGGLFGR